MLSLNFDCPVLCSRCNNESSQQTSMCYKCKSTPLNNDALSSRENFADGVAVNFLTSLSVCNSLNKGSPCVLSRARSGFPVWIVSFGLFQIYILIRKLFYFPFLVSKYA